MTEPSGDPAPGPAKYLGTKEQAEMAAWFDHRHHLFGRGSDQPRHREQLIDGNDFVITGRQQTDWRPKLRQLNRLSEG